MKKIFLIFALTTLMNIGVNAEENKGAQDLTATATPAPQSNLSDSFMAAFGMKVDAEDNMAVGMSTISTTSVNQVTPPFTPHIK
jgi:hypothetical protein